jgi:hypothetical protein
MLSVTPEGLMRIGDEIVQKFEDHKYILRLECSTVQLLIDKTHDLETWNGT